MRRALFLVDNRSRNSENSVVIGLDTDESLHSVSCEFLDLVLQCFSFNDAVIGRLKTKYHSVNSRIKIYGKAVTAGRGSPLSPALFALLIEPLAPVTREDVEITGLLSKREHEICLYRDSSLNTLMSLLKHFGPIR